MPIPPDTRAPGDTGHITDHNNIADELTALTAAAALALPKAGGTMSGAIAMGGSKVTGAGNASASGDLVPFGQLGSAAFQASSAFDAAGAASAAQANAIAAALPALAAAAVTGGGTLALNTVTTVTATSAVAAMTLPSPAAGALIAVERESASTQNVTIAGSIRGSAATITLSLANESEMFLAQGGTWWPVAGHKTLSSLQALFASLATASTYTADQYFKSGRPWFDVIAFGADPSGATDSTTAFNNCILAITGAAAPAANTRNATGAMYVPPGTYKVTGDILIQSVVGFHLFGAGSDITTIKAAGTGFTTAVINIDGSLDGLFEGFTIIGDGTDSVPNAVNLTWTTAAHRSTSADTFRNIRIRQLNFTTGISIAGIGGRQIDGILLEDIFITGQQTLGAWSTSGPWQNGIVFGNGTYGNIYNQNTYNVHVNLCYYGYYCNASGFSLIGSEPFGNAIDFWIEPAAQCTIQSVQSQNSGQMVSSPAGPVSCPVSFRDVLWKGWATSGYTNLPWVSIGTSYGNWLFENVTWSIASPSAAPVMNLGSGGYNACFTLINVTQGNTPSAGIVPAAGVPVIAINYKNSVNTAPNFWGTQYPFYAVNTGVLYQQGTAANRPSASAYGEMFYYATDTSVLSRSNGTAWTTLGLSATAPDIQWYTATGTATWTKPPGAVTTEAFVLSGGGGGGSGRQGAVSTVRCGGGGGAGATLVSRKFVTSDLASSVTVTVGDGGVGGAAVTTIDTSGSSGSAGGTSSFGAYLVGPSYGGGAGGTAAAGTGGTGVLNVASGPGSGASASTTGGVGASVNATPFGAPGGPSGGGVTTANVAGNGAGGFYTYLSSTSSSTFGQGGTVDTSTPTTGTSTGVKGAPGGSPGSGAASITTAAQKGADAYANSGAGGAGGGASLDGNNSGAGGKGGSGFVLVVSYFQ